MPFAEFHYKLDEDDDRLDRRKDILTSTVFRTFIVGRRTSARRHRDRRRRDADRDLGQDRRLEDSRRGDQRNPLPLEDEPFGQDRPRQRLPVDRGLLREQLEREQPDS